jgi:hypothetical protein
MRLLDRFTGTKRPEQGVQPLHSEQVRAALLAVNRASAPYAIREATAAEGVDLVGEWRLIDTEWRALFCHGGITKTYKILMRLDPACSEVRTLDKAFSVTWNAGIPEICASLSGRTGQFNENVQASQCGFDEHGRWAKLYDYTFRTQDIKEPLRGATTKSGWVWRALVFGRP